MKVEIEEMNDAYDENAGWNKEKLQEIKEWTTSMVSALNLLLLEAGMEPVVIK